MHSAILPDDNLKALTPVRPMLMFTGFLGAGKTTLLRTLLDELNQRNQLADVILNDRENAYLDRETLIDHASSVSALTGSCVCCEGLDELCRMILKAAQSPHQLLLIELNGTADPLPLQETFTLLESKFLLHPRWQVCVIDARHFGQRQRFHELEKLQLETASHYYLSHTYESIDQSALIEIIESINPLASRTTAPELAEALSQATTSRRGYRITQIENEKDSGFSVPSIPSTPKPHLHTRHQFAHEYTGCNIVFPEPVDSERIRPWLEALPQSVIRAKALLTISAEQDQRYLYERVGMEASPNPIPVCTINKVPCSGLFIGPDLQPDKILAFTREALHPLCHFPKQ